MPNFTLCIMTLFASFYTNSSSSIEVWNPAVYTVCVPSTLNREGILKTIQHVQLVRGVCLCLYKSVNVCGDCSGRWETGGLTRMYGCFNIHLQTFFYRHSLLLSPHNTPLRSHTHTHTPTTTLLVPLRPLLQHSPRADKSQVCLESRAASVRASS